MAEIGVRLGGDNSAFRGMLDESEAAVSRFGRSLTGLIPMLSGAAVAGFFKGVISDAGALQDLSDRINVSTDSIQAFNFAVKQAGGTTEQATSAWDKAQKALDNLAAGTPAVVKQFAAIGLSAESFVGLNLDQALEKIAVGYRDNSEAAGAFDAITDILGAKTSPRLMVALMKLADDGLPAFTQAAKNAGQVMEKETIAKLDQFGDNLEALHTKLKVGGSVIAGWAMSVVDFVGTVAGEIVSVWKDQPIYFDAVIDRADKTEKAIRKITPALADQSGHLDKIAKLQEKQQEATLATLAAKEQVETLETELLNLQLELFQAGDDRAKQNETEVRIEEVKLALIKARSSAEKETDKEKAEAAKLQELYNKLDKDALEKKVKDSRELAVLLLKSAADLSDADKLRIDVLTGVTTQEKINAEIVDLTARMVAGPLTEAERGRLALLTGQTKEIQKQEKSALRYMEILRAGDNYQQQSAAALQGVIDRLKTNLLDAQIADINNPYKNPLNLGQPSANTIMFANELANALKTQAAGTEVKNYLNTYGEAAARYKYGDAATQSAAAATQSAAQQTAYAVTQIAQGLQNAGLIQTGTVYVRDTSGKSVYYTGNYRNVTDPSGFSYHVAA